MTLEELLGAAPRTGSRFRDVEHGGLPVMEGVPGVLLGVQFDVGVSGRRRLHAGDLVTRNVGVAPAEVELQRDADPVQDIQAARDELLRRGIEIGEPFYDAGGIFHHASPDHLVSGPNPQRKSYASDASFSDPDGNGWVLQEVTARLTGHIEPDDTSFTPELTDVVRRAAG